MAECPVQHIERDTKRQCHEQTTNTTRFPRTHKKVDINSLVAFLDKTTLAPAILRLPNEMLDRIASFLVPSTEVHIKEGMGVCIVDKPTGLPIIVPGKCLAAKEFQSQLSNLRDMALVCRHFRPIVERILYQHICLPQPAARTEFGGFKTFGGFQYPASSLPYLVRTMFDRPDLAARIESLKVWIRDRRLVHHTTAPGTHAYNPFHEVFKAACEHLGNIQMSFTDLVAWSKELHDYQELGLHAILISLLPNLKHLDVNWPYHHPRIWIWTDRTERPVSETPNYACLDVVLRRSSLTSVSIGSYSLPLQNFPANSLTTLTLDYLFFGDRMDWLDSHSNVPVLPSVYTMSVTLDVNFPKTFVLDRVFTGMHPSYGLQLFLLYGTPSLQRLALEPPGGTEPRLDTIYGRRGEELAPVRSDEDPQDLENNPRYNSLFGDGDQFWDGLLLSLIGVRNQLLHLSLPANWYSSTGQMIKPIPTLQTFRRLQTLRLPNVAIIGNPHSKDYDADKHERHAVTFLPRTLETFIVTQANTETCTWLQEGFNSIELLPGLNEVELHFREDYWAIFPDGFEEAATRAGVRIVAHWKGRTRVV